MARAACALVVMSLVAAGCGRDAPAPEPYVLRATVGTYEDGSGRIGMAGLTAIRAENGEGPDRAWELAVARGGSALGATAWYPAHATHAVSFWPDVAPSEAVTYDVLASDGDRTLDATVSLGGGAPLEVPAPVLAVDGAGLEWSPVSGAMAYACVVSAGAALHVQQMSPVAGCDLAALPAGGYLASIEALSADPLAIAAGAAPALPARFDVSHARLGILRRTGGAPLALRAAGGRIDYGLLPGLAIWTGLSAPDGAPAGGDWSIEVTGPNLPPADPLRFTLPASFTQRLVWAYGLPPDPGLYTLTARSGLEVVTTQFAIGAPAPLPLPTGISVQMPGSGVVRLTWDAVPGARSYLAAAWLGASFVAGQWVAGAEAQFPAGTFTTGTTYDVYVTATDVGMSGGAAPPTRVSASENGYAPANFVGP
jgi:hypothetical protein